MDVSKNVKRAAAGTAMAGALGIGILGVGGGIAAAKPGNPHPSPNSPGVSAPANPGNGDENGNGAGGGWMAGGNVNSAWLPGMPPGQNPFGPPGQVMKMPTLALGSALTLPNGTVIPAGATVANPFLNTPPGQWGTVDLNTALNGMNPAILSWLPPNSGLTVPLPLQWDAAAGAWGVTVNGVFTPYPIQFPAPMTG